MKAATSARGKRAEVAVARHLQMLGYEICTANYRVPRIGELDLVIRKGTQIIVVEVKARSNSSTYGGLPDTITTAKLRRLRRTTLCYLQEMQLLNNDVSFLAAFVRLDSDGEVLDITTSPIEWL